MKKSLLAVAVIGAFASAAQAQSSVTVYGVIDTSVNNGSDKVNLNGTTTTVNQRTTGAGKDGLASSRLGIKGTEDLGGGLKANFLWEQGLVSIATGGTGPQVSKTAADADISTQTTTPFADAREVYVGLSDEKMGEFRLGRQATSVHSVISGNSAGGANNVAGALYSAGGSVQNSSSSRPHDVYANRVASYTSPVIAGFSIALQTANQTAVSETSSSAVTATNYYGGRIAYTWNKLNLGLATSQVDLNGATTDIKKSVNVAGANYDFGIAKAFGLYTMATQKLASGTKLNDQKAWELGVSAPVTPRIDLWASYLGGNSTGTGATSTSTLAFSSTAVSGNVTISGYQLGTKYNLSKRTSAYAVYGSQARKGDGVSSNSKNETTQVALGLNHVF